MDFKSAKTGQKRILFDAVKDGQNISPKWVLPDEEQELKESRRLWKDLTSAILNKDMEAATDAKSAVEDAQREQRKTMEESGQKHVPRFFELREGRWEPRFTMPGEPKAATTAAQQWIFGSTQPSVPAPAASPSPAGYHTVGF